MQMQTKGSFLISVISTFFLSRPEQLVARSIHFTEEHHISVFSPPTSSYGLGLYKKDLGPIFVHTETSSAE